MTDSGPFAALTPGRLVSIQTLVWEARAVLEALEPQHSHLIRDLPTRLAVLEGLISSTSENLAVADPDWRPPTAGSC